VGLSLEPAPTGSLHDAALRAGRVAERFVDEVDREARFPREAVAALREERLLGAMVPTMFGGLGASLTEVAGVCETLGARCANTAMVFAMHQIEVHALVRHGQGAPALRAFLHDLASNQLLLASATTEREVGGDIRSSRCAVVRDGTGFRLRKDASVISYGEDADAILVTARREPDAAPGDQVLVLALRSGCTLERTSGWDTLGFRGTCSSGYLLEVEGPGDWILPEPFSGIVTRTMLPTAHTLWASLWLGIATDAVRRARAAVRTAARRHPDRPPAAALRIAELTGLLQSLSAVVHDGVAEYERRLHDDEALAGMPFALRMNNVKTVASRLLVEIVSGAMLATGLEGYRRDSSVSVERHLRDAFGAPIMVGNDRITGNSAAMLTVLKDG
jgi:acyl-CoA dehydrogenase